MKKIIILLSLMFVFTLFSCDTKNDIDDDFIETEYIYYAMLENEESIKNKEYTISDFNLEGLCEVFDCNKISDINNVNLDSYRKILKFNFSFISDEIKQMNKIELGKDDRVYKCFDGDRINRDNETNLEIFNNDSLEKNIDYSKIIFNGSVPAIPNIDSMLINSIEKNNMLYLI